MYDLYAIIVNFDALGVGGGVGLGNYRDTQLGCDTYACLYLLFFLVDRMSNKKNKKLNLEKYIQSWIFCCCFFFCVCSQHFGNRKHTQSEQHHLDQ